MWMDRQENYIKLYEFTRELILGQLPCYVLLTFCALQSDCFIGYTKILIKAAYYDRLIFAIKPYNNRQLTLLICSCMV